MSPDISNPTPDNGERRGGASFVPISSDKEWSRRFAAEIGALKLTDKHKGLTRDEVVEEVCIELATERQIHVDDVRRAYREVSNDPLVTWTLDNLEREGL